MVSLDGGGLPRDSEGAYDFQGNDLVNIKSLESSPVKGTAGGGEGANIVTDGGMEIWTDPNTLTNWTTFEVDGTLDQESTIVNSGTYASKITMNGDGDGLILESSSIPVTEDSAYKFKFYARNASDNGFIATFILNNTFSSATKAWNFYTETWDDWTGGGDFTDANFFNTEAGLTDVYQAFETEVFRGNSDEEIYVFLVCEGDANNVVYLDTVTVKEQTGLTPRGENLLTNESFEDWAINTEPDDWGFVNAGGSATVSETTIEADINSGSAAAEFTNDGDTPALIEQLHSSLTPTDEYSVKVFAKYDGSGNAAVIILDNILASATQIYNFTNEEWEEYNIDKLSEEDYHNNFTLSDSYGDEPYETDTFIVPANGKISVMLASIGENANVFIDDVSLATAEVEPTATPIVMWDFKNASDIDNLDVNDFILRLKTTDGTETNLIEWLANGSYTFTSINGTETSMVLKNLVQSNASGSRRSALLFAGCKADGTETALGNLDFQHNGTGDDFSSIAALDINDGTAIGSTTVMTWEDGLTTSYGDVLVDTGILTLKETTEPSAVDSHGKIYTKTDNNLYFQDGAGNEKQISTI